MFHFFSEFKHFHLLIYSVLVSPHFVFFHSFVTFYVESEATRPSWVSPICLVYGLAEGTTAQSWGTCVLLHALPLQRV